MRLERSGPSTFRAEIDPLALLLIDLVRYNDQRRWCVTVETYAPAPGLDLAETTPLGHTLGPEFRSIAELRAWARDPATDAWAAGVVSALRGPG